MLELEQNIKELKQGDIISLEHRYGPYTVTHNLGKNVVAVSTINLINLDGWLVNGRLLNSIMELLQGDKVTHSTSNDEYIVTNTHKNYTTAVSSINITSTTQWKLEKRAKY